MGYLDVLAALFAAGGLFYVYRLLRPKHVQATYGYTDWQNEIGHGLCMFGMVTMLSPVLLPIPALVWTWVLGAGAVFFTVRALTWGKRVGYATKWWWDWAHVLMLGGMATMYAGFAPLWLNIPFGIFWAWLGAYYLYQLAHDLRTGKLLYVGSDVAHAAMGIVMLLMVLFPAAMMPGMGDCCCHSGSHGTHQHGSHQHGTVVPDTSGTPAAPVDHGTMDHSQMDHGSMDHSHMHGGSKK